MFLCEYVLYVICMYVIVCSIHVFELMQYPNMQTYFQVSSLIWYTNVYGS